MEKYYADKHSSNLKDSIDADMVASEEGDIEEGKAEDHKTRSRLSSLDKINVEDEMRKREEAGLENINIEAKQSLGLKTQPTPISKFKMDP